MTRPELTQMKAILSARKADLEGVLGHRSEIAIQQSSDMLDQIQSASERDLAIGNLERESLRLREVDAALERMADGAFGTCAECGDEIGMKRLKAVPWAPACLRCQETAERAIKQRAEPIGVPSAA